MKSITDILTQAFILPDFLAKFVEALHYSPTITLEEYYRSYERRIGLHYQPGKNLVFTHGSSLACAYLLILWQKEKFINHIPNIMISDCEYNGYGNIIVNDKITMNKNLRYLLIRMRNALAHGNVEISENMSFRFKDRPNNKRRYDFDVELSLESLMKFMCSLTKALFISRDYSDVGTLRTQNIGTKSE